jgi:hypothetical protein
MKRQAMTYKGRRKKDKYFEGWYYKFVVNDQSLTLSLIPGISKNKIDPHAFIQVIINKNNHIQTEYVRYHISDFNYDYEHNIVRISDNAFGQKQVFIDINSDLKVKGQINIGDFTPIRTSIISPSIMGFFEYLPLMECNHDVVSMNHTLSGDLEINGQSFSFNQGKGYIEKDYGKSFPEKYVWIQSNHFSREDVSLMASYASIPYLGLRFKGFIINLVIDHKEYRFSTYNFSKIKLIEKSDNHIILNAKRGQYSLSIKAENKDTIKLPSPKEGIMNQHIKEGLSGYVHILLKKKTHTIIDDIGYSAGIEIMM